MLYTCHILGLLALAPAAPIPGRHRPKDVALPVWPLSIEPSVETKSRPYGRQEIAIRSSTSDLLVEVPIAIGATPAILKRLSMPISVNQIAPLSALNTSPAATSSLHQQLQWSPSDISNVLFGCITSVLGVAAILVTYYLHRRRSHRYQPVEPAELDDTAISGTSFSGEIQPLQELLPSYAAINDPSGDVDREVTESPVSGSPVTPQAAH